jgi:hypothetical protein
MGPERWGIWYSPLLGSCFLRSTNQEGAGLEKVAAGPVMMLIEGASAAAHQLKIFRGSDFGLW